MHTQRNMIPLCSDACWAMRKARLRPQTFKACVHCGKRFGPVSHLKVKLCSAECRVTYLSGRKSTRKTLPIARNAQRALKYHVDKGNIVRPAVCEECGTSARPIEGAHHDYREPLRVRWLCRPCHIRWDKREPKGATYRVPI